MAGVAPPVMLMICWLVCGPSVKRENGIETEIPVCKIKFELSNRKKTSRKTTSIIAKSTSQPKLYSFVRLSFMRRYSACRFTEYPVKNQSMPRIEPYVLVDGR